MPQAPTTISLPLLDRVQIASPCSVRWEDMRGGGDERTRHCAECNLSVHNIAGMTRLEAETLLARHFDADGNAPAGAGRICAQIYRRADGTILTTDCPVGIAALRAKARRTASRIAAVIGLTSLVAWAAASESGSTPFAKAQPLARIAAWLRDPGPNPLLGALRGKVAMPGRVGITPPPAPVPPVTGSSNIQSGEGR